MKRLLAILFLLVPVTAFAAPRVSDVRLTSEAGHARLELDLAGAPAFHVFYLADPYRIVIDMEAVDWQVALPARSAADGPVGGLRHGVRKSGAARLVLDLTVPARISNARYQAGEKGGKRLVIDVRQVSAANFATAMERYQPVKKASAAAIEMTTAAGGANAGRSGRDSATVTSGGSKWLAASQAAGTPSARTAQAVGEPAATQDAATQNVAAPNIAQARRAARQVYREPLLTDADAALRAKGGESQRDPLEYTSPDGYYFSYMQPPGSLFGAGVTVGMQF
ncbi:MAG TPA: AMIN domain-containing protein [Terriglobia bacterium]|nr:AMIN domain-containing protein [Terriglobia bacterium]